MEILAAENKNRQVEDLPQADFGRLPGRFLLSVRTKSMTDNFCILKITPTVVFEIIQRVFFYLKPYANAFSHFYSGIVDTFIFIHQ